MPDARLWDKGRGGTTSRRGRMVLSPQLADASDSGRHPDKTTRSLRAAGAARPTPIAARLISEAGRQPRGRAAGGRSALLRGRAVGGTEVSPTQGWKAVPRAAGVVGCRPPAPPRPRTSAAERSIAGRAGAASHGPGGPGPAHR